jgi:hypothetical protein
LYDLVHELTSRTVSTHPFVLSKIPQRTDAPRDVLRYTGATRKQRLWPGADDGSRQTRCFGQPSGWPGSEWPLADYGLSSGWRSLKWRRDHAIFRSSRLQGHHVHTA